MGDRFASHTLDNIERAARHADTPTTAEHDWVEAVASLDDCDGYVVLAVDPQTGEIDAHGPYGGPDATVVAESFRSSLVAEGLEDVAVRVVRLHFPSDGGN